VYHKKLIAKDQLVLQ